MLARAEEGPLTTTAGICLSVLVQAKDRSGLDQTVGGDICTAKLIGPTDESLVVTDQNDGQYRVDVLTRVSGKYWLTVWINDEAIADRVVFPLLKI